jgi:hypothetical protein
VLGAFAAEGSNMPDPCSKLVGSAATSMSAALMRSAGLSASEVAAVTKCVADSGGTEADAPNPLLEAQIKLQVESNAFMKPTVKVDGRLYRGNLECENDAGGGGGGGGFGAGRGAGGFPQAAAAAAATGEEEGLAAAAASFTEHGSVQGALQVSRRRGILVVKEVPSPSTGACRARCR